MAYVADIPKPLDPKSQSQVELRGNFNALNAWVNIDHGGVNGPNLGMHNKVTLPVQSPAPTFTNPSITNGFYTAAYAESTKNELFVHKQRDGAATGEDIPMTASILGANIGATFTGWTYLPSGILMKWGAASGTVGGTNVDLNAGGDLGPNFVQLFTAQATCNNGLATISISYPGLFKIDIFTSQARPVTWFAIGR